MSSQSVAGVRKRKREEGRGGGEGRRGGEGRGEKERGGERGKGEGRGETRCNIPKVFFMFSRVLPPMMTESPCSLLSC